jgi:hypothetical protein
MCHISEHKVWVVRKLREELLGRFRRDQRSFGLREGIHARVVLLNKLPQCEDLRVSLHVLVPITRDSNQCIWIRRQVLHDPIKQLLVVLLTGLRILTVDRESMTYDLPGPIWIVRDISVWVMDATAVRFSVDAGNRLSARLTTYWLMMPASTENRTVVASSTQVEMSWGSMAILPVSNCATLVNTKSPTVPHYSLCPIWTSSIRYWR